MFLDHNYHQTYLAVVSHAVDHIVTSYQVFFMSCFLRVIKILVGLFGVVTTMSR